MRRTLPIFLIILTLLLLGPACEREEPENALVPEVGQWVVYGFPDYPDRELYLAIAGAEEYGGEACLWLEAAFSGLAGPTVTLALLVEEAELTERLELHRQRIEQPRRFEELSDEAAVYRDRLLSFDAAELRALFDELLIEIEPVKELRLELYEDEDVVGQYVDIGAVTALLADEVPPILEMVGEILSGEPEGLDLDLEEFTTEMPSYRPGRREALTIGEHKLDCQTLDVEYAGGDSTAWFSTRVPLTGLTRLEMSFPEPVPYLESDTLTVELLDYGFGGGGSRLTLARKEYSEVGLDEVQEGLAAVKLLLALGVIGQQIEEYADEDVPDDGAESGEEMLERIIEEELGPEAGA
ncbi:MAG: hypothetical protein GF403_07460 [Candidatus Coatesbacteria bacterium]|nr:hypothetical protein [Candidatus Coatesbacteria bacterium]